jgi:sarcosine oxidase subunit alpha
MHAMAKAVHDAVNREVKNTRDNLGLLDASTLGQADRQRADAGKFLDMMYTNMMSNLAVGQMPLRFDVHGKRFLSG